jgi:hypothetical protein
MRHALVIAASVAAGACSRGEHTVVRTVLDRTGVPMPGVRVQVEDQPWQTTDADGKATFAEVAGPFTVRLHQSFDRGDPTYLADVIQVLRGRTGREVVAEVGDAGPVRFHSARVIGTVTGRSGLPSTVVRVGVAYRDWSDWTVVAGDGSFDWFVPWRGVDAATEATVVLRAWESDAANPPGHYYGFGSASVHLNEYLGDIPGVVSLPLAPVAEGAVEGAVTIPSALMASFVETHLSLAFSRYEALELVNIPSAPEPFTLPVPSVPGGDPWISVVAGQPGVVVSWHNRRVTVPSSGLVFEPPGSPELVQPAAGAAIGDGTVFGWSPAEPAGSSTLYVECEWTDSVTDSLVDYFVEAGDIEAALPAIPGVSIAPGAACRWAVFWCAATDPAMEERCAWSADRRSGP